MAAISRSTNRLPDQSLRDAFAVFQIPYSAVQRGHEQLITETARSGAGTLVGGGVARGGSSHEKQWRQGPLSQAGGVGKNRWETSGIEKMFDGMSSLGFTLRFTLSHPDLSGALVGTSSVDHVASNVAIAEKDPLPAGLLEIAKRQLTFLD